MKKFDLILFGGTGDLSMRKLLPAMYRAFAQKSIDPASRIFVCCRKKQDYETLNQTIKTSLEKYLEKSELTDAQWQAFEKILRPVLIDIASDHQGWTDLKQELDKAKHDLRIFYLAIMPSLYASCCEKLAKYELRNASSRLIVEKPLGYDFDSAEAINQSISEYFTEEQIYRIDHYLGKEAVQNLLALRFSNFLFESLWDSKSIDHVQITITETVGLEGRGEFYDSTGAMRDMVQNHLLQLLCLVAMEPPSRLSAEEVRNEKIKVLKSLKPIKASELKNTCVRGQYVSGQIDDVKVPGYLDELENISSNTETYVAIKANIANWRWAGVPFYLRTGKRLNKRNAEIVIQFKQVTHNIYEENQFKLQPNRMVIQLQPEEKILLYLMTKDLGANESEIMPIALHLDYKHSTSSVKPSAYQRLILDAVEGNSTLFIHRDEAKAAWSWVDPIIKQWQSDSDTPEFYKAGSTGPNAAKKIFENAEHSWFELEKHEV